MHPEKYYAHEPPVRVSLPDVRELLGIRLKRINYDVTGEWNYYLVLDQFLNSASESRRAAAGWGGDRYEIYEGSKPGEVFLAQLTVWDTENDAREFFDAYAKRTQLRYENAKDMDIDMAREKVERRQWHTNEGRVVLEMRGKRVLILEGIPESADANGLLRAVWG